MQCHQVYELKDAVSFVTDDCKLLNPVNVEYVNIDGEGFMKITDSKYRDAIEVANALRNYIDAIPKHIDLGVAMPGVDRDWVDSVLDDD